MVRVSYTEGRLLMTLWLSVKQTSIKFLIFMISAADFHMDANTEKTKAKVMKRS